MDFRSITDPYIPSWAKTEVLAEDGLYEIDDGGDIANGTDGDNIVAGENGREPNVVKESNLWPVSPFESGEGSPYAPIDWPNPGDIWTWKVGRRITAAGYFQDRLLYPPKYIVPFGQPKYFASKAACENFIKSKFPDEDPVAFFASFSWKIPAKRTQEDEESAPVEVIKQETPASSCKRRKVRSESTPVAVVDEKENKVVTDTSPSSSRQRKGKRNVSKKYAEDATLVSVIVSKKYAEDVTPVSVKASKSPTKKRTSTAATPQGKSKERNRRSSHMVVSLSEDQNEVVDPIPEDFDNYLNSLDDILGQYQLQYITPNYSSVADVELGKARAKLSSFLMKDFPSLVSNRDIQQLISLTSIIRKDPTLSAEQLVKLKLIDEMPLFSEVYVESMQTIKEVDEFFASVEDKKAKVADMKIEYHELKEKAYELQKAVDHSLKSVQEIDDQIELLKSRRGELIKQIEANKTATVEVTSNQKIVASSIPVVVNDIQIAMSMIPDMEQKKSNAQRREVEILEKFASLKGLVL